MFLAVLLMIILVPLADLVLLLIINSYLTFLPTLMLVIGTGVAGAWLARRQWEWLLRNWRDRRSPVALSSFLSDGAMILMAAALLITPGFITDLVGISLLIPACRRWYRMWLASWISSRLNIQVFSSGFDEEDEGIVEGRVHPSGAHRRPVERDRIDASPF